MVLRLCFSFSEKRHNQVARFESSHMSADRISLLVFLLLSKYGPGSVSGEAYQDRLIEPEAAALPDEGLWHEEEAQPEGLHFYSIGYQNYRQESYDSSSENGLLFNWRRETLDLGELSLEATVRNGGEEAITQQANSGQFTFHQRGFVLDESREMDTTAGVLRSLSDAMLTSGFRLNLHSPPCAVGCRVMSVVDRVIFS